MQAIPLRPTILGVGHRQIRRRHALAIVHQVSLRLVVLAPKPLTGAAERESTVRSIQQTVYLAM